MWRSESHLRVRTRHVSLTRLHHARMQLIKRSLVFVAIFALGCDPIDDGGSPDELEREAQTEETIDNLLLAGFPEHEIGVLADGTVYVGGDAVVLPGIMSRKKQIIPNLAV